MSNPTKHNITENNPFITPDNYFDKLEDSILQKTIGGEPKKILPFSTPANYFTDLEESILGKTIQEKKKQKGKIIPLFTKRIYAISAAACLIIAITIGFYALNSNNNDTKNIAHQNNSPTDTIEDKLYITKDNIVKNSELPSDPIPNNQETKNSYVSNESKTKVSIKAQNKKANTTSTNKEKRTSEIIYGLYFEDDFPELEEEYF